ALPLGGVAGRHDVDMAVVDQRAPAALAGDDAHGVLAAGLDRPQVDVGAERLVDPGDELGDLALAAHDVVVDLAGVLRIDAGNANGLRDLVHELVLQVVDPLDGLGCGRLVGHGPPPPPIVAAVASSAEGAPRPRNRRLI